MGAKKFISIFAADAILLAPVGPSAVKQNVAYAAPSGITIYLNNVYLNVEPVLKNGTTLLPLATIAKALGYDGTWDNVAKSGTIQKGTKVVSFSLGSIYLQTDKGTVTSALPVQIIGGRVHVPVRAVANALDIMIAYNAVTKRIDITTTDTGSTTPATPAPKLEFDGKTFDTVEELNAYIKAKEEREKAEAEKAKKEAEERANAERLQREYNNATPIEKLAPKFAAFHTKVIDSSSAGSYDGIVGYGGLENKTIQILNTLRSSKLKYTPSLVTARVYGPDIPAYLESVLKPEDPYYEVIPKMIRYSEATGNALYTKNIVPEEIIVNVVDPNATIESLVLQIAKSETLLGKLADSARTQCAVLFYESGNNYYLVVVLK